jgi:hypothetical protein
VDESSLQRALAARINLQILISQIPAVKEHMDLPLSRWLDSVPLPPEMPSGESTNLAVAVGSDLTRLRWSAYGHPAGFIPKMADYFQKCGMTPSDLDLINRMGDAMEPNRVGSWIRVIGEEVRTGWQFREPMPLERIAPFLGEGLVVTKLMMWTAKRDIDQYCGFYRSVGAGASSILELTLPGETAAEQAALASEAFADLGGAPLPDEAVAALGEGEARITLAIEVDDEKVLSVAAYTNTLPTDALDQLCEAAGVDQSRELPQIGKMLQADGYNRIEYCREVGGDTRVEVEWVPQQVEPPPGGAMRQN